MRLLTARVRNYRTVGSDQTLRLDNGLAIVGPNNSGKTNLLKAIQLFFTGWENSMGYDRDVDLTFGVGQAQTSLVATFSGDDGGGSAHPDTAIYAGLDRLHELLGTTRDGPTFTVNATFPGQTGRPTYRFFPNQKQPDTAGIFSRQHKQLVTDLLSLFELHYVPSAKSIADLYDELLNPVLRNIAAAAIMPQISAIETELNRAAGYLNEVFRSAGLDDIEASFEVPGGSHERLLRGFDLMLADPDKTTIFQKGQGIQSIALLASFLWITRVEAKAGKNTIWLLEEPESYLHPELSQSAIKMLEAVRSEALVVLTTHSLAFVPTDPGRIAGTSLVDGRTRVEIFDTYVEATGRIRASLGVRFSDYFNLGVYNILLEGPTDRELVQWAQDLLFARDPTLEWPLVRQAELMDFGGVKHLAGFLRAAYAFIRDERSVVAVFDGDAAGSKERRDLQQFFGQKHVPFEANRHYVSVRDRFAIEGLFPDEWIVEMQEQHPNWFETFSVDAAGDLEPFSVEDAHKRQAVAWLRTRAEAESSVSWAARWVLLLSALNTALEVNAPPSPRPVGTAAV